MKPCVALLIGDAGYDMKVDQLTAARHWGMLSATSVPCWSDRNADELTLVERLPLQLWAESSAIFRGVLD
jgi:hypothetical protein